jgi:hypothetical protein
MFMGVYSYKDIFNERTSANITAHSKNAKDNATRSSKNVKIFRIAYQTKTHHQPDTLRPSKYLQMLRIPKWIVPVKVFWH